MDIKKVQERAKQLLEARRTAWDEGVLDARYYGVQLTSESFLKLVSSGEYNISLTIREDAEFPVEASFTYEDMRYLSIFTKEEYKQSIEILGGKDNESITTA